MINQEAAQKPKLWLVTIGVSAYADKTYALHYAAKDAADLAAAFEGKRDRFSSVEIVRLLDGEATKEKILASKAALMRSSVNDHALVFVAGHGLLDEALDYYFATVDIDFDRPSARGLGYEDIEGLLDGIPARKKMLMMDTCHSGEVDKATTELARDVVVASAFRGLKRARRLDRDESTGLLEDVFADLRRGFGAMVISSASGVEFALESSQLKNGVFTSALLDALRALEPPKVSELRDRVTKRVLELTGGEQHPTSRRENIELDFLVY